MSRILDVPPRLRTNKSVRATSDEDQKRGSKALLSEVRGPRSPGDGVEPNAEGGGMGWGSIRPRESVFDFRAKASRDSSELAQAM